jgi:hypothetical protein
VFFHSWEGFTVEYCYPNNTVPQEFANQIKLELKEIFHANGVQNVNHNQDFNPIMKVPLIVSACQQRLLKKLLGMHAH